MNVVYRFGNVELRREARRLLRDGVEQAIGGRAFDLLLALLERRDRVVSAAELYALVWPGVVVEPNNLQVQIWGLRNLLGRETIATIARRGYRFMPDVSVELAAVELAAVELAAADPPRTARSGTTTPRTARQQAIDAPTPGCDDAVERVASLVVQRRRLTLLSGDDDALRDVATRTGRRMRTSLVTGVWQLRGVDCIAAGAPLIERLARRDSLLLLLDCHHDAEAARATATAVLAGAPRTRILATARHPLGYAGEHMMRLPLALYRA